MSDRHIDYQETQSYGPFAVNQIQQIVVPLDRTYKSALKSVCTRLTDATGAVAEHLHATSAIDVATYKRAAGEPDPVAGARDVLRRLLRYAQSRPGGDALAAKLVPGGSLTDVARYRPTKLLGVLSHAADAVPRYKAQLPEHKRWVAELTEAREALDGLHSAVRRTRSERRAATPELQAARAEWLKVYGAAKLLVESVLRLHDRTGMLPEVFDDLAEVHRAPGVTDEPSAEVEVEAAQA